MERSRRSWFTDSCWSMLQLVRILEFHTVVSKNHREQSPKDIQSKPVITEYYPIFRRNLCQCKQCRKQTSVTAGTVLYHRHLPMVIWFCAIYLCVNDERGISASQLSKMLRIGYEVHGICSSNGSKRCRLYSFRPTGDE